MDEYHQHRIMNSHFIMISIASTQPPIINIAFVLLYIIIGRLVISTLIIDYYFQATAMPWPLIAQPPAATASSQLILAITPLLTLLLSATPPP